MSIRWSVSFHFELARGLVIESGGCQTLYWLASTAEGRAWLESRVQISSDELDIIHGSPPSFFVLCPRLGVVVTVATDRSIVVTAAALTKALSLSLYICVCVFVL